MQSDDFVTLFYNKRTGTIKDYCTGTQSMGFYGDEQQDFEQIFSCVVEPRTSDVNNVIKNKQNFAINTATKEIEQKEESVLKYKIKAKKK